MTAAHRHGGVDWPSATACLICDAQRATSEAQRRRRKAEAEVERMQAKFERWKDRSSQNYRRALDAEIEIERLQEAIKRHRLSCPTTVPIGRDADLYAVLREKED